MRFDTSEHTTDDTWGAAYVFNYGVGIFTCPGTDRMLPQRLTDRDFSSPVTRSIKCSNNQNMPVCCLVLDVSVLATSADGKGAQKKVFEEFSA